MSTLYGIRYSDAVSDNPVRRLAHMSKHYIIHSRIRKHSRHAPLCRSPAIYPKVIVCKFVLKRDNKIERKNKTGSQSSKHQLKNITINSARINRVVAQTISCRIKSPMEMHKLINCERRMMCMCIVQYVSSNTANPWAAEFTQIGIECNCSLLMSSASIATRTTRKCYSIRFRAQLKFFELQNLLAVVFGIVE